MKVIIVGAGIAGLSTAWALMKQGAHVTLFEQGPIPNPLAASGDHHRIIRRAYPSGSGYGRAITEAYDAWEAMWRDIGGSHLDPRGFLCVSREDGDEADDYRKGLDEGGFAYEMLTPDEVESRHPFIDGSTVNYGYFSREGGALHCRKIAADLAIWLRVNGCHIRDWTKITAVDPAHGAVHLANGEDLAADLVIVTAGAWVTKLFPDLGGSLATWRTAVVYLDPPADLVPAWEVSPVILDVGGNTDGYIIPPSGGGGLKFGTGLHKRATDDADADRTPEPGEGEAIRDRFAPPFRRLDEYRVHEVVTCAYTFTRDETFFAHAEGRCLVVSACSGHGYKFGAAVGRRAARYAKDHDIDALRRWLRAEDFAAAA